jgi:hypothetical protein
MYFEQIQNRTVFQNFKADRLLGKTRRRGGLTARTARKDEQRRMVPRARCWRVHSARTHKVNAIEAIHDRLHAACEGIQSGQLPVLGLLPASAKHSTGASRPPLG